MDSLIKKRASHGNPEKRTENLKTQLLKEDEKKSSLVIPIQEREKMMKSLTLYKNSPNPDAKKAPKSESLDIQSD